MDGQAADGLTDKEVCRVRPRLKIANCLKSERGIDVRSVHREINHENFNPTILTK